MQTSLSCNIDSIQLRQRDRASVTIASNPHNHLSLAFNFAGHSDHIDMVTCLEGRVLPSNVALCHNREWHPVDGIAGSRNCLFFRAACIDNHFCQDPFLAETVLTFCGMGILPATSPPAGCRLAATDA